MDQLLDEIDAWHMREIKYAMQLSDMLLRAERPWWMEMWLWRWGRPVRRVSPEAIEAMYRQVELATETRAQLENYTYGMLSV